jgi:hypothetical protein
MDWSKYEEKVFESCKLHFRDAIVSKNVKKRGRYSKRQRQIDILIEQEISENIISTVIDCKFYTRKVDVKKVESFIGMLDDVNATRGILITEAGYTKSALERAYNNPLHLELDIFSLHEFRHIFQAMLALPYSGENAVILVAPMGYIVDGQRNGFSLCTLYQRGLTLEEAFKKKEFAYINFENKTESCTSLEEHIVSQEKYMKDKLKVEEIYYQNLSIRHDAKTRIRIADIMNYPALEITGFVEFNDFIFYCVWFSERNAIKRNMRKLEILMKNIIPIKIKKDSSGNKSICFHES